MSNLEADSFLADARKFTSAAAYDVQQFPEDSESRQAIHNVVSALEALVSAIDAIQSADE